MAYEGEELNACGVLNIDFRSTYVVAVSGDGPNVCGHLIIYAANSQLYFHVAGLRTYPRYMTPGGYTRYLRETGKSEWRRVPVSLPNPEGAADYVERALSEKWTWLVLPNNCVSFCEDVIHAGGGTWSSASNCPAVATDVPQHTVSDWFSRLENDIYRLYGVPH